MNEQTAPLSNRNRLPGEPYPGLRPFLDFEAALLFGRERQVREVIAHLRQTQFVAVLGGSGSGKSSLIHAGVVPELRSFGIADAGDLWLPMTCTPGTNVGRADGVARRHSPVTRLARRFAGLLRSRGSAQTDAQRLVEIADVFRQEAGFARLIDAFGGELAVAPGPDPAQARVLFVLDQFEEIFHPSNRGVADASLLVERTLDHFFNPHPRCHVVLTMRSEHLNDCAAYLELPDAINKSSYLIRRLDEKELHDAIVGPAQRFLRLVARTRQTGSGHAQLQALPREVVFEPAVLERLLRDVKAITHDPDHLPLLQHLLARLWDAALQREGRRLPVPTQIQWADLVLAVHPPEPAKGTPKPENAGPMVLEDSVNTLRASVQNWPEREYRRQAPEQRKLLDGLLCQLAFKDPNTGLYSQQRLQVQDGATLLGEGKAPADLRALIAEGFLGSVDYLFWDDEDPSRVTLKVSHESFIRGWQRFRQLVDAESSRFEDFVAALRKCAAWDANQRSDMFLIDEGDLSRFNDVDLAGRLAQPWQRENWFRLLLVDRDGPRLATFESQLDEFVRASRQRVADRDRRLRNSSRRTQAALISVVAVVLLWVAYSALIETPVTQRAMAWLEANRLADLAQAPAIQTDTAAAAKSLQLSLRAAELVDDAMTGRDTVTPQLSGWLLHHLQWLPPVRSLSKFLAGLNAQIESSVNKKLREVLTKGVWRDEARDALVAPGGTTQVLQTSCAAAAATSASAVLTGRLFVANGLASAPGLQRAIFTHTSTRDGQVWSELRSASYDVASQRCEYGPLVTSGKLSQQPRLQFDAQLRSFAATADPLNRVLVNAFDWAGLQSGRDAELQFRTLAVIDDLDLVAKVKAELSRGSGFGLQTRPLRAGEGLLVGGQTLRAIWPQAAPLVVATDGAAFTPLQLSPQTSACAQMSRVWQLRAEANPQVFESAEHCFLVAATQLASVPAVPRAHAVWVYAKPQASELAHLLDNPPVALATLSPFAAVNAATAEWLVAEQGELAGWLAVRSTDGTGKLSLLGAPWSTCALWRLGIPLLSLNGGAAQQTPTPRSGVCAGR
jgi:energy-coupling factor transporter ATP-binding protein EcfA2